MLKNKLLKIKESLDLVDSYDLFTLVENRLSKTFNLYVEELQENYNKLLRHRDIHVLKRIARGGGMSNGNCRETI